MGCHEEIHPLTSPSRSLFHVQINSCQPSRSRVDRRLLHQTIRRTRSDFDDAIGANAGNDLIRHKGASTYRLAVEPDQIEISRDLMELVPDHISVSLARALLEPVSECQQQTSALSSFAK